MVVLDDLVPHASILRKATTRQYIYRFVHVCYEPVIRTEHECLGRKAALITWQELLMRARLRCSESCSHGTEQALAYTITASI